MNIALNEIWNFLSLLDGKEKGWDYMLCAGGVQCEGIDNHMMMALQHDDTYDTELLPSIFTFREILWQPDVFTEASMSIPSLRILEAFCLESAEEMGELNTPCSTIYVPLVKGLADCCAKALAQLEGERVDVKKVLGNFRTGAFPIVKFFIYHPKNRYDYHQDAINRLNYAVKIMLTQFYGRYTELKDPYWHVSFTPESPKEAVAREQ